MIFVINKVVLDVAKVTLLTMKIFSRCCKNHARLSDIFHSRPFWGIFMLQRSRFKFFKILPNVGRSCRSHIDVAEVTLFGLF